MKDVTLQYLKTKSGWKVIDAYGRSAFGATKEAAEQQYNLLHRNSIQQIDTSQYIVNPFRCID